MASKYLNDCSLSISAWAICSDIFDLRDIAVIEREFLAVLDFELNITLTDMLRIHKAVEQGGKGTATEQD